MLTGRLSALWACYLVFALSFLAVLALTRFDYPIYCDEVSFYHITLEFGAHGLPPVELLRSYDHAVTPMMFLAFGLLGRVAGLDLWKMRAPEFVNYLVLATGVYSLPLALLRVRHMFRQQRLLLTALLTPLFWLAIPRPKSAVLNLPVKTLGFLNIVLTRAFGDHKTIPYVLLWLLGCFILQEVVPIERDEAVEL